MVGGGGREGEGKGREYLRKNTSVGYLRRKRRLGTRKLPENRSEEEDEGT